MCIDTKREIKPLHSGYKVAIKLHNGDYIAPIKGNDYPMPVNKWIGHSDYKESEFSSDPGFHTFHRKIWALLFASEGHWEFKTKFGRVGGELVVLKVACRKVNYCGSQSDRPSYIGQVSEEIRIIGEVQATKADIKLMDKVWY